MIQENLEALSVVVIIYKQPLADGTKYIQFEMDVDNKKSNEMILNNLAAFRDDGFIFITNRFGHIKYVPVDNIGLIEVY